MYSMVLFNFMAPKVRRSFVYLEGAQLENIPRWGKNILRGGKLSFGGGQKYTKHKLNNSKN